MIDKSTDRVAFPTLEELIRFAVAPSSPEGGAQYRRLISALKTDPTRALEVLNRLASHPKASVREWASGVGAQVCEVAFIPTLVRLFSDRSQVVQSLALKDLEQLGTDALRLVLPQVRQKLVVWGDDDGGSVAQLMWVVAELNDVATIPLLRQLAKGQGMATSRNAEAVIAYLEEGAEGVLRRIREHDHDHMLWLCRVAWGVGTKAAVDALEACADSAPDDECRRACRKFHRSLLRRRAEWDPPFWKDQVPG